MQKMIEQAGPSRQLFETVNFAFMKNFDFLVKITIFWAFLLFLGDLCHKLQRTKTLEIIYGCPLRKIARLNYL